MSPNGAETIAPVRTDCRTDIDLVLTLPSVE